MYARKHYYAVTFIIQQFKLMPYIFKRTAPYRAAGIGDYAICTISVASILYF